MRVVLRLFVYLSLFPIVLHALTLDEAIDSALAANWSLKVQEELFKAADAHCREEWGRWLPQVGWSGEARRTPTVTLDASQANTFNMAVSVTQALLNIPAWEAVKAVRLEAEALGYELDHFIDQLLLEVRTSYYAVILADQELLLQEEIITRLKEELAREKMRLEVGATTPFAVQQAQVAVANRLTVLYGAKQEAAARRFELAVLIGQDPSIGHCFELSDQVIPLESEPFFQQILALPEGAKVFSFNELCQWERLLWEGRADLKRAEAKVRAAQALRTAAQGEYLPQVDGFVSYTQRSDNSFGARFFAAQTSFWESGLRFNWPLFDGFSREARNQVALAERGRAEASYQKTVLDAKLVLHNRFEMIEQAFAAFRAANLGTEVAGQAVELAKNRREAGAITALEYRDAITSLSQARQSLLRSRYDLFIAYFGLRRDVGLDRLEGNLTVSCR